MRIGVIGSGYVGLVAATCLAESGNQVMVMDADKKKIQMLRESEVPIYEPGLRDLLRRNVRQGRLEFTSTLAEAVSSSAVVFIAVGTPSLPDGRADISQVLQVAREIGRAMQGPLTVVNKSTVPVGTAALVKEILQKETAFQVSVASNPEFLKEGAAIDDFMRPDRVVLGVDDERARELLAGLYAPFVRTGNPILFLTPESAEMTKYAANGLLALRISFINEMAALCDQVGADVESVRLGLGSDKCIGHAFLFPGVGFGGSCFPKDIRALMHLGKSHGMEMALLTATDSVNQRQKQLIPGWIIQRFGANLSKRTFALWGLAFKPRTDDVREAPALTIVQELLNRGAHLRVYDPAAMKSAQPLLGDRVECAPNGYDCCRGADALIVATEWNEFRHPDFERIKSLMKHPVVFDGRNIYSPHWMQENGFEYHSVGRASVATCPGQTG